MNNMTIPYVNISKQWNSEKKNILQIINNTMSSGSHVGGKEILKFEKNIKNLCKKKYCVALNSGTDALTFALYSLGIRKGDEVITIPNSFVASTSCIVHLGARPVFVDVQNDQNINPDLIENYITKKTKAIMPVHLTGRISEMKKIMKISKKYNIPIIEDAAQAIGSKYYNQPSGFFGSFGCFSAHPLKNLNALGDSGFLVTNQKKHYNLIKDVSNHGMSNRNKIKNFGHVSRMDNLQAGVLNYRLKNLDKIVLKRRRNAKLYEKLIDKNYVYIPQEKKYEYNTYHTYVVQVNKRDKLKKFLLNKGISTAIHYPIPIHLQPASKYLGYNKGSFKIAEKQAKTILSLPIHQYLSINDIEYISKSINSFFKR